MTQIVVPSSACSSRSRSRIAAPGGAVEVAGRLVGEDELRADRRGPGRWPRAGARRPTASPADGSAGPRARPARARPPRPAGAPSAGRRGRAARRRRCRRRSRRRAGRTTGRRTRCARPAAPTGRGPTSPTTSWPAIRTEPSVGRSSVPSRCRSVDLPEPDGPTIPSSSPRSMCRSTPAQRLDRRVARVALHDAVQLGDGRHDGTTISAPTVRSPFGAVDLDPAVLEQAGLDADEVGRTRRRPRPRRHSRLRGRPAARRPARP